MYLAIFFEKFLKVVKYEVYKSPLSLSLSLTGVFYKFSHKILNF